MKDKPECHIFKYIVFTDSILTATAVVARIEKRKNKGKKGYCVINKKRIYWKLR